MIATDTTTAWIGLIGVATGALVTAGVSYALERANGRAEFRTVRKLAKAEIAEIGELIAKALAELRWPPGYATKGWAQSWSTNRRVLARHMEERDFAVIATAYGFTEQLQSGLVHQGKGFEPAEDPDEMSPDMDFFLRAREAFAAAAGRL
jgi:hypothetical protein